ncbi:MAG: nucleotidyltransferase domain-containing protein [Solirubrobacteraceae bacterium]
MITRLAACVSSRGDNATVAIVGARARDAATAASDLDVIVLTPVPEVFTGVMSGSQSSPTRRSSPARSSRDHRATRPTPVWARGRARDRARGWAAVDPVDAGTRRVFEDRLRIVHDPDHLLARLRATLAATA